MSAQKPLPLKYIAAEKIYLADANHTVDAGAEFAYAGLPSANMVPTCAEGRKRREEAITYDKKGRHESPAPVDAVPEEATKAVAAALAKAKAKAKKVESGDEELA